jgi:hypothetical protein
MTRNRAGIEVVTAPDIEADHQLDFPAGEEGSFLRSRGRDRGRRQQRRSEQHAQRRSDRSDHE